jgi:hypothetical protein
MKLDLEYQRNHVRVRRTFGKASEYDCYVCSGPARDWAWHWKTHSDPADPESYFPMCVRCHCAYDRKPRTPQTAQQRYQAARQRKRWRIFEPVWLAADRGDEKLAMDLLREYVRMRRLEDAA